MKYLRAAKCFYIACSVMLCIIGVVVICLPHMSAQALCIALGIVSLVYGAEKIIGYFARDLYRLAFQFDLALGIFVGLFGLLLLVHPRQIINMTAALVGLFAVIEGVFKIQTAVDACRFGLGCWWLILAAALCTLALGALLLINPFKGAAVVMTFVGISLLVDGLQNLFNAFYTIRVLRRAHPEEPDTLF